MECQDPAGDQAPASGFHSSCACVISVSSGGIFSYSKSVMLGRYRAVLFDRSSISIRLNESPAETVSELATKFQSSRVFPQDTGTAEEVGACVRDLGRPFSTPHERSVLRDNLDWEAS